MFIISFKSMIFDAKYRDYITSLIIILTKKKKKKKKEQKK